MIFAAAAARDRFGHYHVCRGLRHRIEVWHCPFNSIVTQQKRSIYFFFSSLNPFNLCWVSWGFWPLFLGFKHSIRPHSEQAITVTQPFTFLRTHVIVKLENNSWHCPFTASYFNEYMCSVYNLGSVCIGPQFLYIQHYFTNILFLSLCFMNPRILTMNVYKITWNFICTYTVPIIICFDALKP